MIAALGCKYVILGHSERRQYYGETSETLNKKMVQAYANGLTPIYCVGESLEERKAGNHFAVCKAQIEEVVYNLTEEQFANLVIHPSAQNKISTNPRSAQNNNTLW